MRLLLVGAFPYPHDQGSQIYFQEQAIALRSAGADVSLLTYASRKDPDDSKRARALAGFVHWKPRGWTSPRSLQSGPSWGKPLADFGLAMTLRDAIASQPRHDAFDAILTHNAEAAVSALLALGARSRRRPRIVYCAHTLLRNELAFYLKSHGNQHIVPISSSLGKENRRRARALGRLGGAIDRWVAARSDGWIALTQTSERVMRHASSAPGALIPPPIPDPRIGSVPLDPQRVARQHGLVPGRFFLYSGNRDRYQELDILRAVAGRRGRGDPDIPLVVAGHPDRRPFSSESRRDESMPGIETLRIGSPDEMLGLIAAARASLVLRRTEGGFPIKLANSLAVGTPPIAFRGAEWGLTDGRDSVICQPDTPVVSLAAALERLARNDGEVARLAAGARTLYEDRHRPERVAGRTLALIEEVVALRRR